MTVTAAVYLRVSTDEQTVENQREPLVNACALRGWTPVFYEDVGESGAKRSRPAFDRMKADVHAGKHAAVVVAALDRLGRDTLHVLETVQGFDAAGAQVVSLREDWLQLKGPVRQLLTFIIGWVAEQERRLTIERSAAGQRRARRDGKHIGRKKLETDPKRLAAAQALRAAFIAAKGGMSVREAARRYRVSARTLARRMTTHEAAAKPPAEIPPHQNETPAAYGQD